MNTSTYAQQIFVAHVQSCKQHTVYTQCTHTQAGRHASTHTCTYTKSYQVIHQLIGTDNVHILKLRGLNKLSPHPPRNCIIWPAPPRPAPPRIYFDISWPATQPAAHWSGPQPAPPRNKYKNPARGLRAETRPAQGLIVYRSIVQSYQESSDARHTKHNITTNTHTINTNTTTITTTTNYIISPNNNNNNNNNNK